MNLMSLYGIEGKPKAPSSVPKQHDVVQWQLKDGLIESQLGPASESFLLRGHALLTSLKVNCGKTINLKHLNGMGGDPKAPSSIPKQPDVVQWHRKDGLRES